MKTFSFRKINARKELEYQTCCRNLRTEIDALYKPAQLLHDEKSSVCSPTPQATCVPLEVFSSSLTMMEKMVMQHHKRKRFERTARKRAFQAVTFGEQPIFATQGDEDDLGDEFDTESTSPRGFGGPDEPSLPGSNTHDMFGFPTLPVASHYQALRARFKQLKRPIEHRYYAKSLIGKYYTMSKEHDDLAWRAEAVLVFNYMMWRAQCTAERMVAVATFAKCMNQRLDRNLCIITALRAAVEWYYPVGKNFKKKKMQTQGLEETFTSLRGFLDKYEVIKTSPLFEKMYKFGSYALALSLFAPLGITMDHLKFDKVAQEAIKRKYHLGPDMIHSTLDTALFLTQRGYQCYQVGSIMPMFHSADKYQEWYDKSEVLLRQANFLSNPEVHGIDRFKYLADLKDTIECGRSMKKCATKKEERLVISKILGSLELTHDLEVTKRAAQRDRKLPLCALLYGGSGIGKSTLQNIMYHQYGEVCNLSTLPEYRYVRNPTEAFWSGMNSTQWCIIMDDIAFLSPRLGVLDPSLAEMLCVANNVPFVPAQAELSDKGRTPVRAELVLGSTNTEHMNLHAYFSCPLAVQRRFPWVIDVAVKEQYQSDDKPGMLCSTKVPETPEGEYPDLWNFTIKRVEPCGTERANQMGKTVVDCHLTSMAEFIKWFNGVIAAHNTVQDKIMAGNLRTYNTHACQECKMPANWCSCMPVQALEYDLFGELEMATPAYIYATECQQVRQDVERTLEAASYMVRLWFYWYYAVFKLVHNTRLNDVVTWWRGDYWFQKLLIGTPYKTEFAKLAVKYAGHRVNRRLGTTNSQLVGLAATIAGAILAYKAYGWLVKEVISPEPQGSVSSTHAQKPSTLDGIGKKPEPDAIYVPRPSFEEKYPYNSTDLSQTTLCSKGTDGEVLKGNVRKATVAFKTVQDASARVTTAVNIRGTVFMCNYHGIPPTTPFTLDVVADAHEKFTGSVKGILITSCMVDYYPAKDLAFIHLRCLPTGTNLVPWIAKNSYTGKVNGMYIGRERTGEVWERAVRNIQEYNETWNAHGDTIHGRTWGGIVDKPTKVGDCGSLLITHSPAGWALLGVHTLGAGDETRALRLDPDFVLSACAKLEPEIVSRGKVVVSAPSAQRNLSDLNVQSVARQVAGSGNIIGSFTGEFRQRGRTNVKETLLASALKVILGFEHTRAKPDMTRRPWLLALKDMVDPVVRLNNDVLKEAQEMFIAETRVMDYTQVFVYDLDTAINGCPGLQYCDKMNRKSSAGAPYKKSKSHFMYFVDETSTDMDVVDEIKDTVASMIETYKKGERVHAIFCGHAKDEPVTIAKAIAGKTRIFTAAGMAHTLVTRMYLLSVIVFIQKRRFNFESGVGVAAQTLEWQEMYEYVTEYGTERMIAGDYAKFDKRMPANVILAAFDILIDICKRGGYSDDSLKVVRGIAYDTAFPTIDFHGDLIEFFGSNPSGHALTVIINDLANSLYMRYTFIVLRPLDFRNLTFKQVVKLLTYGDDNAMGVRDGASWFNHTAIQAVLGAAGIGYTMAEKEAESVPYITMDEVSFLKRVWRWEPAVRAHVAPLALDSMEKMLMVCVEKKNISPEHHAIQVVGTAVREYFFHGRETFEKMSAALKEAVWAAQLDLYVEENTFLGWDQLVVDFEERSKHVKIVRDLSC